MTEHTPETLLKVAQEVMPLPRDNHWMIETCPVSGSFVAKEAVDEDGNECLEEFRPETNDSQFRALAEWCAVKGFSPNKVESLNNEFAVVVYSTKEVGKYIQVVSTSHTDCMIAAVLAHKQSSESGEVDCG